MRSDAPFLLLLFVFQAQSLDASSTTSKFRDKRNALLPTTPLVYPFGGTLKLLMGHTMPIAMPGRILSYLQNVQFQFALPQNASFFTDLFAARRVSAATPTTRRRRQSDLGDERAIFYQFLQQQVQRRGGPGKECVKRSICELAETPLGEQGLVGEILQVLLTPDYGGSVLGVDDEYLAAAVKGRRSDNTDDDCQRVYNCPKGFGLLDHISRLLDHD